MVGSKYNVYYKDRNGNTQRANSLPLNKVEMRQLIKELERLFQNVWNIPVKED
jgi:hypothetical protein